LVFLVNLPLLTGLAWFGLAWFGLVCFAFLDWLALPGLYNFPCPDWLGWVGGDLRKIDEALI
jgi:hypothetical protein